MILVPLPAVALGAVWPAVAPFAEQMAEAFPDDWPVAEIRRRAEHGLLRLWAVWDGAERSACGLIGTEIHVKPSGRKALVVALAAGHDHRRWVGLIAALERHASAEGCDYVEVRGRAGWARHLSTYRATNGVVLTKELN